MKKRTILSELDDVVADFMGRDVASRSVRSARN
jgi:hypothetical protein